MKKGFFCLFLFLFLFLLSLSFVLGECRVNGEVVPCSEMPQGFWVFIFLFPLVMIPLVLFWGWMFIDCIFYEEEKLLWILLMIFTSIIGAIIYYFVRKRKRVLTNRVI